MMVHVAQVDSLDGGDDICDCIVGHDAPTEERELAKRAGVRCVLTRPRVDALVAEGVRARQRVRVLENVGTDGASHAL